MNTDFKTDWDTIGDYSGLSGKPYDSGSSWNDFDLTKALTALGKSQRRKEYSNWAKQTPRFGFSNQNNRNPGAFPLGQDAVILPGSDQMGGAGGYTIPGSSRGASTTQKLGQAALSVAPFTGPAAPIVAGVGAIANIFG
jgi:hypothetical protein